MRRAAVALCCLRGALVACAACGPPYLRRISRPRRAAAPPRGASPPPRFTAAWWWLCTCCACLFRGACSPLASPRCPRTCVARSSMVCGVAASRAAACGGACLVGYPAPNRLLRVRVLCCSAPRQPWAPFSTSRRRKSTPRCLESASRSSRRRCRRCRAGASTWRLWRCMCRRAVALACCRGMRAVARAPYHHCA